MTESTNATIPAVKEDLSLSTNFKLLMVNGSISRVGMGAYSVILLWVTLALTHSPVITGLADGMVSLPLFASFIVGALVDRNGRKKLLGVAVSIARPAIIGLMFLALMVHNIYAIAAIFFTTSILIGFTSDVLNSVRSVWSKQFLNEATYKKGTSLSNAVTGIAETVGFAVPALLFLGFSNAFLILMAIFAAGLASILPIRAEREVIEGNMSTRESVLESLRFIKGSRLIVEVLILSMLANFLLGTIGIGLTVLVQKTLDLSPLFLALLLTTLAVAMIVGSIAANGLTVNFGKEVTVTVALVGIFIWLLGTTPTIYYDFPIMAGIGFVIGFLNVGAGTLVLKRVPMEMMARIQGSFSTIGLGMTFISGTVGGILVALTSSRQMLEIIGFAVIAIAIISVSFRELYRTSV